MMPTRLVFSLWILASLLASTWSFRVNHAATHAKAKTGAPLRWFQKRVEDLFFLHPGTIAEVNWDRHQIAQRLSGRWFGVQGAGNHADDFIVIDMSLGEGNAGLHLQSNIGLAGDISTKQLVAASKEPRTIFQVQTAAGVDTMYMSVNYPDRTFRSLLMVPSEAERTEDDDEVIALFKVSDWLGPKEPEQFPTQKMYERLHATSIALNKEHSLPTPAFAQGILPSAFDMPDWIRNAFGKRGEYAGGGIAKGPHEPLGPSVMPVQSAMKGGWQAKKEADQRKKISFVGSGKPLTAGT